MTVPSELWGAWRRVGLVVDGVPRVDHCEVLWLQGRDWYADIRLRTEPDQPAPVAGPAAPFAAEMAFAGPAHWAAPVMTWEHVLDSGDTPSAADSARLDWADGVVVERGERALDGRWIEYQEDWLRMTAEEPVVTRAERSVRVVVGRWGIVVTDDRPTGEFVAVRLEGPGSGGGSGRELRARTVPDDTGARG